MKSLFLYSICFSLCLLSSVSHAQITLVDRVTAYLAARDLSYSSYAFSGEIIIRVDEDGNYSLKRWPEELGPKPLHADLPSDPTVIANTIQQYEDRKNLARQNTKSTLLKAAETQFISYLKSENLIAQDAKTVTRDQLAVAMAVWAQLPDEQAEIKYSKYARLVKRIEISGGSEYDVWEH